MNRRHFFASGVGILSISITGCVDTTALTTGGSNNGSSDDETTENDCSCTDGNSLLDSVHPELSPGDETTLLIEATDIRSFRFSDKLRYTENLEISNQSISPSPETADLSDPPKYHWTSEEPVAIEYSVRAKDDAEAGEYRHRILVGIEEDDERKTVHDEICITILEE